jgi:probable F420-dependent oxidoreductase
VQIGIRIPCYRRWCDREAVLAIATEAEALGYGAVFVQDHIVASADPALDLRVEGVSTWMSDTAGPAVTPTVAEYYAGDDWWLDPFMTWAFVAGVTERVLLGSDIVVVPYRNPLVQAKMLGTLDVLSNGRLLLGTGTGHVPSEFSTLGIDFAARGRMHDEYLRIIAAALESDEITFDGEFHSFGRTRTLIRSVQSPRPPIFVGGNGPRSIRRAVELGDGWIPSAVTAAELATGLALARELADESRRATPLRIAVSLPRAFKLSADGAPRGERSSQSAAQIIDQLRGYADLGVELAVVGLPMPTLEVYLEQLRIFASLVMPDTVAPR